MSYRAPVADIMFALRQITHLDAGVAEGVYADLGDGIAQSVIEEAGKFAQNVIAPLNRIGDVQGSKLKDGAVATPQGWASAYREWVAGGWNGLCGAPEHGGQGLPHLLNAACLEMWCGANVAFTLCPLLNFGAIDAVQAHATNELQQIYLAKLISGEWTGTMNLTEPQAGSDLALLRAKAERAGDGTYRISGQKIYISYGEHDLAENIIHLVLARLPDAPEGTRGISLFLVPKFLVNADGSPGARNDVRCSGVEHKMGIHASPTCTMIYGDAGGAVGWLIGEENRGLNCMFTMMNNARLGTALQGVGLAEAATQKALAYARDRRQGRAPGAKAASPVIEHPDVKRMLMTMQACTQAARAICYATADATDRAHRASDPSARAAAAERAALLTPIAKAFASDIGSEVASLGVQVHGGMGYVEETGAAQFLRDARIVQIYEGTNGIQAIDLVQRKLALPAMAREIADMRATLELLRANNSESFGKMALRLIEAVDALEAASDWVLRRMATAPVDALAGATPFLRLFALARGGVFLGDGALAAHRLQADGDGDVSHGARIAIARFFAENLAVAAPGLALTVMEGAGFADLALAS